MTNCQIGTTKGLSDTSVSEATPRRLTCDAHNLGYLSPRLPGRPCPPDAVL